MPYGGTTPDQDKKIEECVAELIRKGHSKVSAIKICKASIMRNKDKK
jgi:predicted Ser/Thr protein kinase